MRRLLFPLLLASLAACTLSLPGKGGNAPEAKPAAITPGPVEVTPLDAPTPSGAAAEATADPATPTAAKPAPAPKPRPETTPKPEPQPEPQPEPTPEPTPPPAPLSPEQAKCIAKGGTWSVTGLAKLHSCIQPTRDSGKTCRKASDCEGLCLARSRTCAPVKPLFGCNPILQDDGTEATLCID